ncbi:sigma-70 family RNA polymerase sigma factor [Hyalangium sp.]|uniref:sigma-70 family RNA polymerase sigma factor n=1 Tax=Hyalangium sp. TaxID=2028555 RepID=UPI002D35A5FA|nr:sigma-70 family RNA polymerase sigma factor [Hyalangium sp.]HYH99609.1 sigma-70 family RNA polymerase sigma factor [Hyalangium sp.]
MAQDDAEFESLLRRAWETGRRRWPQVDLPADVFIRHLAGLLPEARAAGPLAPLVEQLDLEGLYLACACANNVSAAAEMFEQHYVAKLPALLGYLKLSDTMLDEVCQQVRMHLLVRTPGAPQRLAEYTGRGALLIWIRVIAVRMSLKQGALAREIPDENGLAALENLPTQGTDPEMALMKSHYRHEFREAVRAAFATLSDEQRYLLRLHFIERLPTTRMGPLFGKDQSTISRWLKEARERVYEETKRRLQERLRLSSQEFESLMSTIKSRFDVSLSQFLGDKDGGEGKEE